MFTGFAKTKMNADLQKWMYFHRTRTDNYIMESIYFSGND